MPRLSPEQRKNLERKRLEFAMHQRETGEQNSAQSGFAKKGLPGLWSPVQLAAQVGFLLG